MLRKQAASNIYKVRRASVDDLQGIFQLAKDFEDLRAYPYTFFYYALLYWPACFWVAYSTNKPEADERSAEESLAGFCIAGIAQYDASLAWVTWTIVDQSHKRNEVGKLLLGFLYDELAGLGIKKIRAYALPDGEDIKMYTLADYRAVETINDRMGLNQDRVLLECEVELDQNAQV